MKKKRIILLLLGAIPFMAPVIFSLHDSSEHFPASHTFSKKADKTVLKGQNKTEINFPYSKTEKETNDTEDQPYLSK